MKKSVSMVLAGDSFITQRLPRDAKLKALKEYLESFDVRFTNFEILLHGKYYHLLIDFFLFL